MLGTSWGNESMSSVRPCLFRCFLSLVNCLRLAAMIFLRMRTGVRGGVGRGGLRLKISYCRVCLFVYVVLLFDGDVMMVHHA